MDNWFKRNISSPLIVYLGRWKEMRVFSKSPIFIGGCGRSGTTLLLSILSAHSEIFGIPNETDAFTSWKVLKNGKKVPARWDRLYRAILLARIPSSKKRWCEKRPANIHFIQEILSCFPHSKFLFIVRDPRAVCTSRHPSLSDSYWISIDRYVDDVAAGLSQLHHPSVLLIRYEDLVLNTSVEIRKICGFLEIQFSREIENWFDNTSVRQNRALFSDMEPINQESLYKWQQPEHVLRIEQIVSDSRVKILAKNLGYDLKS